MDRTAAERRRAGSLDALRALTHPVRLRICAALAGGSSSAAALARRLELEHASASYHLRVLRDAGLVALDEQRRINGGLERRYRLVDPPDEPVADEPATAEDWLALVAAMGASLQVRAARVSDAPKWFADLEVWAQPDDITRIRHQLDDTLQELRQVAVAPGTPGASRVSASALVFELRTQRDDAG